MTSLLLLSVLMASPTALRFSTDGTCGDEQTIRDAITVRLGRDPFRDGTMGPTFVASIQRDGTGWASQLSVDGGAARRRTSSECREVTQSLALGIALVLELSPPVAPAPPARPEAPVETVRFSLAAAAFASGGLSAYVTAGGALGGGLRFGRFIAELEVRLDGPSSTTFGGNVFHSFPLLVTGAVGLLAGPVRLTVPLSGGVLFVNGPSTGSSPVALAGVQASGVIALGASGWSLEPFVRAQVSLVKINVASGTSTVWSTWPIAGAAGLTLRHEFE